HTFTATFRSPGPNQYVAAQDVATGSINGGEGGILVNPGPVASLVVQAPTTVQPAGYPISVTAPALAAAGNLASGYTRPVHFPSWDAAAQWPPDYPFTAADRGAHTFTVTPQTAGNQVFTATDKANATVAGSATVPIAYFVPGLHFALAASPTSNVAGTPFS